MFGWFLQLILGGEWTPINGRRRSTAWVWAHLIREDAIRQTWRKSRHFPNWWWTPNDARSSFTWHDSDLAKVGRLFWWFLLGGSRQKIGKGSLVWWARKGSIPAGSDVYVYPDKKIRFPNWWWTPKKHRSSSREERRRRRTA